MKQLTVALILCLQLIAAAFAQEPPGLDFAKDIDGVYKDADNFSNDLADFLQSQGRWFPQPQGYDQQLCQETRNFLEQVDRLARDAEGRQSYNLMPQELQQAQATAGKIDGLLDVVKPDLNVRRNWGKVRGGLTSVTNSIYGAPGFPWNPANPYNPYVPEIGTKCVLQSDDYNAIYRGLAGVKNYTQQTTNQLHTYLGVPGRPPVPPGQDKQLVDELLTLEQQVDSLQYDCNSRRPCTYIGTELEHLQNHARAIDIQIKTVANASFVLDKWANVRTELNKASGAFFSAAARNPANRPGQTPNTVKRGR